MRNILILFFTLITIDIVSSQTLDSIDYKVYSRIIDSFTQDCFQKWQKKSVKRVLINQTTNFRNVFAEDKDYPNNFKYGACLTCIDRIDSSYVLDTRFVNLILRLDTVNRRISCFSNNFQLRKYKTLLIDTVEFHSFFLNQNDNNGWRSFYSKYPQSMGFMTLSRIAYSDDKKYCALYIELKYNSLGSDGYVLLIDTNSYRIIKKEVLWQS